MKIKELKHKQQAEAIENFYNQCSPYGLELPVVEVIDIELNEAFTFIRTKQGYDYWNNMYYNV